MRRGAEFLLSKKRVLLNVVTHTVFTENATEN